MGKQMETTIMGYMRTTIPKGSEALKPKILSYWGLVGNKGIYYIGNMVIL